MNAALRGAMERLEAMMLIRAFETALSERKDHGFQLLSTGEEAVAVGISAVLHPHDQLLTGGRSIGPALARGVNPRVVMAELLGKTAGMNRGRAGRGHMADPQAGFFGAHAVVGGNISIAAGVALAKVMAGAPGLVAILFGDGACGAGVLHETLNIAACWSLPLFFVCNNNQLAVSTQRSSALAPKRLSEIGAAFGLWSKTVDGMDVDKVIQGAQEAVDHIRAGRGPAFLECLSARFLSHSTTARETRDRDTLGALRQNCPIARAIANLALDRAQVGALEQGVSEEVRAAIAFADLSPYPDAREVLEHVG